MITEFQDGFITKTKLNELVGGINANNEDLSNLIIETNANSEDLSNLIIEINAKVLTANVTKTVGSGGDFVTLTEALNWCKTLIPNGFTLTLSLLVGYQIEPLDYTNVDFGFVNLISSDGLHRGHISNPASVDSLFKFTNSISFNLGLIVDGKNNSTGYIPVGLVLLNSHMKILFGCGFYNFVSSIMLINMSRLHSYGDCKLFSSNSLFGRVSLQDCSEANLFGATIGYVYAYQMSKVNISSAILMKTITNVNVGEGSIVLANNSANAILSQTANTITENGIIFQ